MDFYATSLERGLLAREQLDAGRFLDVRYQDFTEDPFGVVQSIYQHFDLPMESKVKEALRDHVAANPQGQHGSHDYALSQFGLTRERVLERFQSYIDRFELPSD
jgi:hypothetical protein